jgi:hypothetical protein
MTQKYPGGFVTLTPPTQDPALGAATQGIWTLDQALTAAKLRSWPMYDPYYNNVVLNLHGNGTNGAQNNTFLDSSTNNFTITRNGNTTQGSFSPYGSNWSSYITASNFAFSNNAVFDFGSGAFTVEMWINITGNSPTNGDGTKDATLFCAFPTSGSLTSDYNFGLTGSSTTTGTGLTFGSRNSGTYQSVTYTGTITQNAWHHVAIVKSSNTATLYLDGSQVAQNTSFTNTVNTNGNAIRLCGLQYTGYSNTLTGYISNARVTKGGALYSGSTYTVPTVPLTTTVSAGTVSLLISQSNRFIDNSVNNFSVSSGTASVQRFQPFLFPTLYTPSTIGGSGYFDGSGDSLNSAANFELSTSTTTFTIEGFVYPTTFSSLINIIGGIATTSGDVKTIAAEVNTSGQVALYWFDGAVKRCTGNSVMQLNAWNYFAIVVSSNTISIYVNKTTADTLSGTTTLTNRAQQQGLGVGAYYNNNAPAQYFNGYLSNLRYSTVAKTISSVPATPFVLDSDTRWLLSYTNAGITDNAMMNNLETVGNAQVSTSVVKYGSGSMSFNGSTDLLRCLETPNLLLQGNFTVEAWVYPTTITGSSRTIFFLENGANGATFYISATGILNLDVAGVANYTLGSTAVTTNSWQHIAFVRSGTTLTGYINGTSSGTATVSASLGSSGVALVGANSNAVGAPFAGYIDDLRITKGYARYTANFTAPTSQLQDQ